MSHQPPLRQSKTNGFFDIDPDWKTYWWGMPAFEQGDARPQFKIVVNFMTADAVEAFAKATGLKVTTSSDTTWFPAQKRLSKGTVWKGPKKENRYPICIPSKGRYDCQTTGQALNKMGLPYRFFVEETEANAYREAVGEQHVVEMPFHDLGRGSIPARNFIWEWAKKREHKRHWVLDDNINAFYRCYQNRRIRIQTSAAILACEDFVDRYKNIAMAGLHDVAFVNARDPALAPVIWNTRIYSCILLDTSWPHRWRGRWNEDTDLSLRLLKDGHCTCLLRSIAMDKPGTAGGKGNPKKGGNTDTVYAGNDRRRAFAESLQKQHPDVVKVVWKFHRWHHQIDYTPFARNKPILIPGIVPTGEPDDYGMFLDTE